MKKPGVVGNIEKITLPNAMDPTKNVINFIEKIPTFFLKMPTRHIIPRHRFKPPYIPAISEYPNGEVIERPTAFKKLG